MSPVREVLAPVVVIWSVAFLCSRCVTICSLLLLYPLPTMALSQTDDEDVDHVSHLPWGVDDMRSDEECAEKSWAQHFEYEQLKTQRYRSFTWNVFPTFTEMIPFCDAIFNENAKVYFGITSSPMWRMYDAIFSDASSVWPHAFEWSHMTILYQGDMADCGRYERCLIALYQKHFHKGKLENVNIGGEQARASKPGFLYVTHNTLSAHLRLMDEYRRLKRQFRTMEAPIFY